MDGRRIRPLFRPPHPRRNRYIPSSSAEIHPLRFRLKLTPRPKTALCSFLLPLRIRPASLGSDSVKGGAAVLAPQNQAFTRSVSG